MGKARLRSAAFWSLVVLSLFNAVSAIGGGIGILATDGMGIPFRCWRADPSPLSCGRACFFSW